jgi:polysaccharide biosynthesis protein PelA
MYKRLRQRLLLIITWFLLCATLICFPCLFAQSLTSIAFNYSSRPPMDLLKTFDAVVIDPSSNVLPQKYPQTQVFAYISVGELKPGSGVAKNIPKSWIIAENSIWKTKVLDQSNPAWQALFIQQIFEPLWQKGYRGFFLDTLDSYQLGAKTKEERQKQINGLVTLIKAIKQKHPQARLILNRGFELLPQTHTLVYAVAAESLYSGWDQKTKTYGPVKENARIWLLKQFKVARQYKLPFISIDYVAPNNRNKTLKIAKQISKLNIIPYVADGDLQTVGISTIQAIPRKIIALYDSKEAPDIMEVYPLVYGATPLEYYGYIPLFYDINKPLPQYNLVGQTAGILVWVNSNGISQNPKLQAWLIKQKQNNIPVVFLGNLGSALAPSFKNAFGIYNTSVEYSTPDKVSISKQTPMANFEFKPIAHPYEFRPVKIKNAIVKLALTDNKQKRFEAIAITSWGGYALNPYVVHHLPNKQTRWIINPMTFFPEAFKFESFPIPDVTTENGKRLLLSHVDGDGFVNRAEFGENKLSCEVMLNEIFKKYRIPLTVSVIEGEISPNGLYPKTAKKAEAIAREIFKLPWVEIASHSYSHPFRWKAAEKKVGKKTLNTEGSYLPIPGYKFDLTRDIEGSVDYINDTLAPPNKQCKIFLWTGDCDPTARAVGLTYKLDLFNMNAGNTIITKSNNSLTNIAPLGVYKGKYFQVFAPNQNENIYTNLWTGPFYGFKRVIETYQLTDSPYRFKPIDVYYHFYAVSKLAGLKALQTVYDWALKQPIINIYASEYVEKVLDYNGISVARNIDNGFIIKSSGNLRELRIPIATGYPDLKQSKNIVGFSTYNNNHYIHLGDNHTTQLKLSANKPSLPYIVETNGFINKFHRLNYKINFELSGHVVPIDITLANANKCKVYDGKKQIKGKKSTNQSLSFEFISGKKHEISISCNK